MFGFPCLALGKNALMLDQPDLVTGFRRTLFGKLVHGFRDRMIRPQAQLT